MIFLNRIGDRMKKKNIYIIIVLVVVLALLGSSYAYLRAERGSENSQKITLANLDVILLNDMTNVSMDLLPMTDANGLNNTPTTFKIKNNGSIMASYRVSLIDGTTASTMSNSDVRYRLKRTVGSNAQEILDIKNLDSEGLIDSGTIEAGETISYELVCWVDYNANPNGLTFSKKILVEGMQVESLDKSGANYPELVENMIPVYYSATSDTEGVWKKADSTNKNTSYKWFNYDEQMWANAVTVKESGTNTREYYLNAEQGTTIEMDDITSMWVWIPRYKYMIFNGNNETAEEQMINVTFEHGKETTGTVMCHDDIQTSDNSDHSEICTDTTNNGIVNFKSTYTHPAFCFGTKNNDGTCNGEELTGFWMAKFEMSTDDNDCNTTPNDTNCNKTGLNILVKPDQKSLMYIDVSSMFANTRRMETYGNIHGFKQNETATTWLNSSSNLTGEIANDDNNIDTHMIKNMEWGAVAYLSQSKYGKQGNSLYTGPYKEIYNNNKLDYKTGYSGGSYNSAASNSATYLYNNLTSNGTGQGYKGAGASTTGTIYGVFDMYARMWNYVFANMVNSEGFFYMNNSVWSSNQNLPLSKYYDSYSLSSNNLSQLTIHKLGDSIKEVIKDKTIFDGMWYNDELHLAYINHQFYARGKFGVFSNAAAVGVFDDDGSSRPVLTITRSMPWLENNS